MKYRLRTAFLASGATIVLAAGSPAQGQSARDLTGFLPAETPVVLDLVDGAACVDQLRAAMSPLPSGLPWSVRLGWVALPLVTKGVTGLGLTELAQTIAPSQVVVALYPGSPPFPVWLSRVRQPDAVRGVLQRLGGEKGSIHSAFHGDVLVVTGTAARLREVRAFLASDRPRLLSDRRYRDGRVDQRPGQGIRFYADTARLRALAGSEIWARLDPGAKVLIGPVLRPLDRADRVDGHLTFSAAGLRLRGRADAGLAGDARRVDALLAAGPAGRVLPPRPAGTLAQLSLDRDLGAVLSDPDIWFGADGSLGVKQFLSTADQLLGGGVSMEADLLPNLRMPAHLFVTATTPDPDLEAPGIALPAFTLVVEIRSAPKRVARMLRRTFGTITAIANVERGRNKQVPIRTRNGSRDGYRFQRIEFGDWNGPGRPPTEHGLSPTLLFTHGRCVLSSTTDGAVRMAKALAAAAEAAARGVQQVQEQEKTVGDRLSIDGPGLAALVRRNASVVAIDRVLDEGETPEEAARFVTSLEAILSVLQLRGSVVPARRETRFEFELRRLRPGQGEER